MATTSVTPSCLQIGHLASQSNLDQIPIFLGGGDTRDRKRSAQGRLGCPDSLSLHLGGLCHSRALKATLYSLPEIAGILPFAVSSLLPFSATWIVRSINAGSKARETLRIAHVCKIDMSLNGMGKLVSDVSTSKFYLAFVCITITTRLLGSMQ